MKGLITSVPLSQVLLLNPTDPAVLTYTEELQRRLQPPLAAPPQDPWQEAHPHPPPARDSALALKGPRRFGHTRSRSETDLGSVFSSESAGMRDNNDRGQPFEFRALEMALEMACSQLHHQVGAAVKPGVSSRVPTFRCG